MEKRNLVFIATSLDGYIADKNEGLDWLNAVPNPEHIDMGYGSFTKGIQAIIMGRKTFETVLGFDVDWPYNVPVYVLSNKLTEIPEALLDKAFLVRGDLTDILDQLHRKGQYSIYIDGGTCIQNFLKEDLIDEMIITTFPILLGGGSSLFADLPKALNFELIESKTFLNQVVQSHYRRKK